MAIVSQNAEPESPAERLISSLTSQIPPEFVVGKIGERFDASFVSKAGVEHPDYRTREAGIKLWLAYGVGMPVQRQQIVTQKIESADQRWARLAASPAAVKAVVSDVLRTEDSAAIVRDCLTQVSGGRASASALTRLE